MKRSFRILIACILACVTLFSSASCDEDNGGEDSTPVVSPTGKYVVQDGKTDYMVVLPENVDKYEKMASDEFITLFGEATSIKLKVVSDKDLSYNSQSKYISIGKTKLLEQAKISPKYNEMGTNGIGLYTKDNSIFVVGGGMYGVVNGVYELLYNMFGFEQYFTDCYYIDTLVTDLPLVNYNLTDSPDITHYVANVGFLSNDATTRMRMRVSQTLSTLKIPESRSGATNHNSIYFLPYSLYGSEHPAWYNDSVTALCWTAHGNEEEYEQMVLAFTESMKLAIRSNVNKVSHIYQVGNLDNNVKCACTACGISNAKYGTASGAYVQFLNRVYDNIIEWFENDPEGKTYATPDFRIALLAYQQFVGAPAKYNEKTKKYEPVDESVKCRDGVIVEYAPIDMNFTQSFDSKTNVDYKNAYDGWAAVSKEVGVWAYSTNFRTYLLPYNTFSSMQGHYQFYRDKNALWIFDQSQWDTAEGMTAWHVLKGYLNTKLAWNADDDYEELISRFFKNYFGPAATAMKKYFDSYRTFSAYQENELGFCQGLNSVYFDALNKKYWPKHVMEQWRGYVNEAIEALESLKTKDYDRYLSYYKHVVAERVFIDYVLISLYESNYTRRAFAEIKQDCKEAIQLARFTRQSEQIKIDGFLEKLN